MTPEERLTQIDEAITAVMVGGQEYWLNGMKVRRADLPALNKMRQQIISEMNESANGNTSVAVFDGR